MIKIEFVYRRQPLEIDAETISAAVQYAVENRLSLRGANLHEADLRGANLSWADLRGADLDFSCWPLWCGSLNVKIDKRIFCQLLYHTLRAGQSIDDPEVKRLFEIPEIVNLANKFHRVEECGKIEAQNGKWELNRTDRRSLFSFVMLVVLVVIILQVVK